MKLDALLRSPDLRRFTAGGRDVGRLLFADPEQIGDARRQVEAVRRETAEHEEYRRGFLDGLEMVMAGFLRDHEFETVMERDLQFLQSRRHWLVVLKTIEGGTVNPSAIAKAIHVGEPSVSKILAELENAGLIERCSDAAGSTRAKPRRLTSRAHVVLHRLAQVAESAPVSAVASAVASCLPSLILSGWESRQRMVQLFEETLDVDLAAVALGSFIDTLAANGLASMEADGALVVTAVEQRSSLDAKLRQLIHQRASIPWLEKREHIVIVRTVHDEWDVLLSRISLSGVRVLRDDDLRWGRIVPSDEPYEMLYDAESLATQDSKEEVFRTVAAHASQRWVLSSSSSLKIPENCQALPFSELFEPRRAA